MCRHPLPPSLSPSSVKLMIMALEEYGFTKAGRGIRGEQVKEACRLSFDGRVFFGANIEFPGLPLHHSIHAEQFLITNMSLHGGGPKVLYMAVSAAPCGHCRQFLQELRDVSSTMIMITNDNEGYRPIKDILPHPFGPFDLLAQDMPLVLEEHKNDIFFNDECENLGNLSNGYLESAKKNDGAAARGSHAPYDTENFGNLSNGYLELAKKNDGLLKSEAVLAAGAWVSRTTAEYNPSMMPVQAALVAYMVGGGGGYDRIVAAVLVEKEGAMVSQEETARFCLQLDRYEIEKNAHSTPLPAPDSTPTKPDKDKDKDSPDGKKAPSEQPDGPEGGVANKVAKKMKAVEKKISEFNDSLKKRIDSPGSSHGTQECVSECDEVFGAALDDIKNTLESLESQNLMKANFDVSAVATNVDTCTDCFKEMVGGDEEVEKLGDWVRKTTGDALEALQKATD
ncbi:cytidine deaminase 1-like protein [Tanacetum coccineum]